VYIQGSVHIAAICAIKDSGNHSTWRYINVYILCRVHIPLKCVIKHSVTQVPWSKHHPSKLGYVWYIYICYICRTSNSVNILSFCVCVCVVF
jgi:hypothetical protein